MEIFYNGTWGTVCDDSWDIDDARVVCRELGFSAALRAPTNAFFGPGSGRIWLDDVECQGYEGSLANCQHRGWGNHDCSPSEDASVFCSGKYSIQRHSYSCLVVLRYGKIIQGNYRQQKD